MELVNQARNNNGLNGSLGLSWSQELGLVCGKFKDGSSDGFFMDKDQGVLVCKKGWQNCML
jgi:hypothetical protein